MYGKEYPSNEKFPPRTWCQYPYGKCKSCYHDKPCIPDYADQYRKKIEDEIGPNEIVGNLSWVTCLVFVFVLRHKLVKRFLRF